MSKIFDEYDSNKFIEERDNYIFAHGGDGTLLRAIKVFRDKQKPFYGVAAGTANFLMNSVRYLDSNIINDNGEMDSRIQEPEKSSIRSKQMPFNLIQVELYIDGYWKIFYAFNEVNLGAFNGWIDFDCKDQDEILGSIKGAGLIISTAQGTTGINKNSGGTILPLSSKNWSVVGIQCTKKINYILEPKEINIHATSRNQMQLAIDGQIVDYDKDIRIKIIKGPEVNLIFDDYSEFKRKRR